MPKDNNKSTLKLPATVVQQLRKLAADHEHQFRKFATALAGVGNPTFTPAQLEQLADLSSRSLVRRQLELRQFIPTEEIGNSVSDELARLREAIAELKTSALPSTPVESLRISQKAAGGSRIAGDP